MSDLTRAIVILDFGGQYAHLIASRIRRFGYKSFILPAETKPAMLKGAAGIILSGGPQSVYEKGSPQADRAILDLGIPILGLCYGHQWLAQAAGGKVGPATVKEYGSTPIRVLDPKTPLFSKLPKEFTVWMSHGDEVKELPPGFETVVSTKDCVNTSIADLKRQLFGIQFHIEVTHTQHGMEILRTFVDLCKPEAWSMESYAAHVGEQVKKEVGDRKVFMLVSGGVDSTVAFTLLNKVLGPKRVQGLLVDTGLMRKNEVKMIQRAFDVLGIKNLHVEDSSDRFYTQLRGVCEPEKKRTIIGDTFLAVQRDVSDRMGLTMEDGWPANRSSADATSSDAHLRQGYGGQPSLSEGWMLGQGTIYPDTIETGGTKHADKIKTHHNRVPLVQEMIERGLVVEPLKELYKDEVRELGEELGLPHELVWRHPFPGPGLGVRILCAEEPHEIPIQNAEFRIQNSVILPIRSVGVQGDGRTYRHALVLFDKKRVPTDAHFEMATSIPNASKTFSRVLLCTSHSEPFIPEFTPTSINKEVADTLRDADAIVDEEVRAVDLYKRIWQFPVVLIPVGASSGKRSIVLRPIESTDAMTAAAFRLPAKLIERITKRLLSVEGIDAVFLDLTNKPPGTIEWE